MIEDIRLPPKWIELNISKRECICFIAKIADENTCQCGKVKIEHSDEALHKRPRVGDVWTSPLHSEASPTDAFGTIVFEGEHHPNKAKYVRLSHDTNPELVIQLLTMVWGLEMPKLLISMIGSEKNFEITPRLGRILSSGLLKAAKSTGAWIFTSGINRGITKHVGASLSSWFGYKKGRVVSFGITAWGVVERREELLGKNREKIYNSLEQANSKYFLLNPKHSNFLLVDNGTVGKVGAEAYFRKRLEKCISTYPTSHHKGCDTPIIGILIEGGPSALKTINDYIYESPPIPVVVFGGSGRTADFLTVVIKKVDSQNITDLDTIKNDILKLMKRSYSISSAQCQKFYPELKKITVKRNLLTLYNPTQSEEESFDSVILASIFRSQHWSPIQQLSLTLVWDRVDIAKQEVFVYGRDWSKDNLENACFEALMEDRIEFVELFLEHGLNMQSFLTPKRLEDLYCIDKTHCPVTRYLLFELAKIRSSQIKFKGFSPKSDKNLTLHDIGLILIHMLGHGHKVRYSNYKQSIPGNQQQEEKTHKFKQPFDDLFIWAVLTKRDKMSKLLFRHGVGALAKSLISVQLNRYLSTELASVEQTETNLAAEFQLCKEQWENISLEMLESCFKSNALMARQILTMELENWSHHTVLSLAVLANHTMLLGHPCCQMLLADLWMGALNFRWNITIKVIVGILVPPFIYFWDFKSVEELKLLPHNRSHFFNSNNPESAYNEEVHQYYMLDNESLITYGSYASSIHPHNRPRHHNTRKRNDKSFLGKISRITTAGKHHLHLHHHHNHHNKHQEEQPSEIKAEEDEVTLSEDENKRVKRIYFKENTPKLTPNLSRDEIGKFHRVNRMGHFPQDGRYQNPEDRRRSFEKTKKNLSCCQKFYEFQRAPITNFYRHTIAYIVFVCFFTYVILVPQDKDSPGLIELYVIAYVATLGLDTMRDFLFSEGNSFAQKWSDFQRKYWSVWDLFVVCFFLIGVTLRFNDNYQMGILLYRVSSVYWNLRLYKYMSVHRFIGPKIKMMTRMLKHMIYFSLIILVVLIAFGIARESIRFPETTPTWRNIGEAFLEPYLMMFGEVDTDSIVPQCGDADQPPCPMGHWIIPIIWVIYMMVSNILIVNVLIAVFNGIYAEVDSISVELWMFNRFTFVMEFEQKPLLPPPFIIITHLFYVLKWAYGRMLDCLCEIELEEKRVEYEDGKRVIIGNDHRLKIFLSPAELQRLHDFEEENVDAISQSKYGNAFAEETMDMERKFRSHGSSLPGHDLREPKGIQHIRSCLREVYIELESQRTKIDRLLAYWEVNAEQEQNEEQTSRITEVENDTEENM